MNKSELNDIYEKLDKKAREIGNALNCSYGYYNGHYSKNSSGKYEMDFFPIPVVEIKNLCDIEIGLDQICITSKLTKSRALSYDYEKIKKYDFEAYGEENYLDDFFVAGDTVQSMLNKITNSGEKNVSFSFSFPFDTELVKIYEFVNLIRHEGFFY